MLRKILITIPFILLGIMLILFIKMMVLDEALMPEAEKWLTYQPENIDPKDNGYEYFMGIFTKENISPEIIGRQRIENWLKDNNVEDYPKEKQFTIPEYQWLESILSSSETVDLKKHHKELSDFVVRFDFLLQRYMKLMTYPRIITQKSLLKFGAPTPPYLFLMDMNHVFCAKIALLILEDEKEHALELLVENMHFLRQLMIDSYSIFNKMLTLSVIKKNLMIISHWMDESLPTPQIWMSLIPVINDFTLLERSMRIVLRSEFIMMNNLIAPLNSEISSLKAIFIKPNLTLNSVYQKYLEAAEFSEKETPLLLTSHISSKQRGVYSIINFRNYLGNIFEAIQSSPIIVKTVFYCHDTTGQMRLLKLKYKILKKSIPINTMDTFLKEETTLCNPYSLNPMQYDKVNHHLFFNSPEKGDKKRRRIVLFVKI